MSVTRFRRIFLRVPRCTGNEYGGISKLDFAKMREVVDFRKSGHICYAMFKLINNRQHVLTCVNLS